MITVNRSIVALKVVIYLQAAAFLAAIVVGVLPGPSNYYASFGFISAVIIGITLIFAGILNKKQTSAMWMLQIILFIVASLHTFSDFSHIWNKVFIYATSLIGIVILLQKIMLKYYNLRKV